MAGFLISCCYGLLKKLYEGRDGHLVISYYFAYGLASLSWLGTHTGATQQVFPGLIKAGHPKLIQTFMLNIDAVLKAVMSVALAIAFHGAARHAGTNAGEKYGRSAKHE